MVNLIYKEEFFKIKQACIEIRKNLGNGFLKKVYEKALKIELMSISKLTDVHKAQIINFLKATNYQLGILINFPNDKLGFEIERIPNFIMHYE